MLKTADVFWIQFAGLYCRVNATPGMKAIINKYFSGSYVSVSGHGPKSQGNRAELVIYQKQAKPGETSTIIKHDQLRFFMFINGSPHFFYPLLANVLQRIFMALWHNNGGIVFHASSVESQGKAYVFVGDSGKGKTTIARLSNELYGLRVLADNQVFIRKHGGKYLVYPFPFTQFHKNGGKSNLPIAAFYILHKSLSFAVKPLSFIEGMHAFEQEIQILNTGDAPSDNRIPAALRRTIFDFAKTITIKRLYFLRGRGVWEAINEFL